jgi:hypothetical protein
MTHLPRGLILGLFSEIGEEAIHLAAGDVPVTVQIRALEGILKVRDLPHVE